MTQIFLFAKTCQAILPRICDRFVKISNKRENKSLLSGKCHIWSNNALWQSGRRFECLAKSVYRLCHHITANYHFGNLPFHTDRYGTPTKRSSHPKSQWSPHQRYLLALWQKLCNALSGGNDIGRTDMPLSDDYGRQHDKVRLQASDAMEYSNACCRHGHPADHQLAHLQDSPHQSGRNYQKRMI